MRSLDRIDNFTDELNKIWKAYFPDWRFGQLMLNFLGWASNIYGDPFFWEEDKFLEYLDKYIKSGNSPFYTGKIND